MIKLRLEEERDYRLVEEITKEAFDGLHGPGCDEHLIAHKLRESDCYVKELAYVIEKENEVIGNIMYSKAIIKGSSEYEVLTFGPVSIKKSEQGKGYGSLLITHTINLAKELGYNGIVIYGHDKYYPRFGFVNAKDFNITTKDGENFDAFMALELSEGSLNDIEGRFYENEVFEVDQEELVNFEKQFM